MEFNHKSGIDIITGPMFSGKSTELLRRLTILGAANFNVVYVRSSLDTRQAVSHNALLNEDLKLKVYKTEALYSIQSELMEYDAIGIDEGQFFTELYHFCIEMCERYNKKIIVAGLNSDFRRQKFGQLMELLPVCDTIVKLSAFCKPCANIGEFVPALFSRRIDTTMNSTISVGAGESYIPTCRECYFNQI